MPLAYILESVVVEVSKQEHKWKEITTDRLSRPTCDNTDNVV